MRGVGLIAGFGPAAGLVFACLVALAGAPPAHAQTVCIAGTNGACFVPADQTIGGNVFTDTAGAPITNNGTVNGYLQTRQTDSPVANGGSVTGSIDTGANSSITNSGTVGDFLSTALDNSPIFNFGTVTTFIRTAGSNSAVTNSGTVGSFIATQQSNSPVTNSGTVNLTITTQGANSAITNTGTVLQDLHSDADNSPIFNSGRVDGLISTKGNNSSIVNSGTAGQSVTTQGNNASITNSGFIADQIIIAGTNPTLNLLGGSVLGGAVSLTGAGTSTLNVGPGLNLALALGAQPTVLNTFGAPFAQVGNQVFVIDPTGFALPGIMIFDVAGSVLNAIDQGGVFGNFGMATHGIPGGGSDGGTHHHENGYGMASGWRAFATGFGGLGEEDLGGGTSFTEMESRFGGAMAGMEAGSIDHGLMGFFAGGAVADAQTQFGTYDVEIDSVFGGAYFKQDYGSHRIHLAFVGGTANHDQERRVANNAVAGGIETGKASYDGWFVAPSATIAVPLGSFVASARGSYTGLFLDGYTETGLINPVRVAGRDIHQFGARGQIALPIETVNGAGWRKLSEFRFGAEGRFDAGSDNAGVTLAGTALSFDATAGERVTGFAGASFTAISPDESYLLGFSLEGQSDFDDTYSFTGSAKATKRF